MNPKKTWNHGIKSKMGKGILKAFDNKIKY